MYWLATTSAECCLRSFLFLMIFCFILPDDVNKWWMKGGSGTGGILSYYNYCGSGSKNNLSNFVINSTHLIIMMQHFDFSSLIAHSSRQYNPKPKS